MFPFRTAGPSEIATRRPLLLRPLIHPVVDGLVPEPRILRLQHPVAFVGEVEHLRRYAHGLQRGEELKAFAYIETVIELTMDDECWRLEVGRRIARRPLVVDIMIGVWRPTELPVVEPEFFGRAPGREGVEHPIVRHYATEAVGMPEDPVGHIAAVARTQRALAVFVYERIRLLGIVEAFHQVFEGRAAPVAVDRVNKLLPVAG